ncbi:sigma-54-dependent transcriptional regulator [Pseudoalteromonas sp. G4]|uniref:sigma-54-dependent transcriptional regulator n=1 Tax=Pseudoalteromonas sp. G4 TaxID=2992761 RepID=UPI00237D62D2|nr:sigma-54 dependent transcriptional regulator [Pseudoalteromonas sp. G4]MDE3273741.1 sigma-54 dependent transcriptional regulator [Pseudoalteromonas sp. G4]
MSHILIADDDPSIVAALRLFLKSEGFKVTTASSPAEAVFFVKQNDIDLALIDLNYHADTTSGQEGINLTEQLASLDESLAIVCMTGWASVEIAVEVMKAGAGDFVEKPWENERLLTVITNQLKLREQKLQNQVLNQENQNLKSELAQGDGELIVESAPMKTLLAQLEQIAKADINVLITGPNGTGKSLLAQHIHNLSNRSNERFVSVNMGAISESLFESELFGHVKGAFTDAKENRIGRVELAEKGTLFMDEIGNIPLPQQAKLLRLLEEHQFEKVGSSKTQTANIRLISATNANLDAMVEDATFRQDLLYRLNTFVVRLPSLAERKDDILPMANNFIAKAAKRFNKPAPSLSPAACDALLAYDWPGNVRELSHTLERATLLAVSEISPEHLMLTPSATQVSQAQEQTTVKYQGTMDEIEKAVIEQRLMEYQGNALDTAKSLGLSRSAFYRRLDKFAI